MPWMAWGDFLDGWRNGPESAGIRGKSRQFSIFPPAGLMLRDVCPGGAAGNWSVACPPHRKRVPVLAGKALDRLEADIEARRRCGERRYRDQPHRQCHGAGNEFEDGSRSSSTARRRCEELWVAAKAGGFHFRHDGGQVDGYAQRRAELYAALSTYMSPAGGYHADAGA